VPQDVVSTLGTISTPTSIPIPTLRPSPTPFDLKGLFCEYQFCIGHPIDMAFFDVSAQKNPASPSTYSQGLIASFNANLFIQAMWQLAPGTTDPQFMLDLIVDKNVDTRVGNLDAGVEHGLQFHSMAADALLQALAVQLLHHDERMAVVVLDAVDGADVGMVELRCGARLASKTLQRLGVMSQILWDELQGDVAAKLQILRLIDHAHTTAPKFSEDAVMGYLLADHEGVRTCSAVMLGPQLIPVNSVEY